VSKEDKRKVPEGAKLIYLGKDIKLSVGWERINLEGMRGSMKGELEKFGKTNCNDDYTLAGGRDPMKILFSFENGDITKYTNVNCASPCRFVVVLGFELRVSLLLGKRSPT
jgi:hypothetical protein